MIEAIRRLFTRQKPLPVLYEVMDVLKHSEEDDWEQGCLSETGRSNYIDMQFRSHSLENLITALMEFANADETDAVLLDSCEDAGRIDICVTEDKDGEPLSKEQWEQFKQGDIKAWYCTYTFQVRAVTERTPMLRDLVLNPQIYGN